MLGMLGCAGTEFDRRGRSDAAAGKFPPGSNCFDTPAGDVSFTLLRTTASRFRQTCRFYDYRKERFSVRVSDAHGNGSELTLCR